MLPIDIFGIVEFGLHLELRPISSLREAGDVEALLLGDGRTIVLDAADFMDDRRENRMRFSVAHEVGHFVLHLDYFRHLGHRTVDEWVSAIRSISEDDYRWLEWHANEFAGRLLVPRDRLETEVNARLRSLEQRSLADWDESGEAAGEFLAGSISRVFGVSDDVIERRLRYEKLLPPVGR